MAKRVLNSSPDRPILAVSRVMSEVTSASQGGAGLHRHLVMSVRLASAQSSYLRPLRALTHTRGWANGLDGE